MFSELRSNRSARYDFPAPVPYAWYSMRLTGDSNLVKLCKLSPRGTMKRLIQYTVLAAVACTTASASLIHEYTFDSGPQATDTAGSQNGILNNGASIAGGFLSLDGVNDFVQFANHLVPTAAPFT